MIGIGIGAKRPGPVLMPTGFLRFREDIRADNPPVKNAVQDPLASAISTSAPRSGQHETLVREGVYQRQHMGEVLAAHAPCNSPHPRTPLPRPRRTG
jgi:hypothetical protein